ncbi:MAG: hypothetical protein OXC44_00255 [Proteobacteria bacterium]|nr:hypothetical protein [Pseudomonadota bacterium]
MIKGMSLSFLLCLMFVVSDSRAWGFSLLLSDDFSKTLSFRRMARLVSERTSIDFSKASVVERYSLLKGFDGLTQMWLILPSLEPLMVSASGDAPKLLRNDTVHWLLRGGFLFVETPKSVEVLSKTLLSHPVFARRGARLGPVEVGHELLQSYYLIDGMPACSSFRWAELRFDGRMMALFAPPGFMNALSDSPSGDSQGCFAAFEKEPLMRAMINTMMVVLTTDYKKDQIHLPEILKRMR